MQWPVVLVLLLVYFIYLVLGGVILHFIETPREVDVKETTQQFAVDFLANATCVTTKQFRALVAQVIKAYDGGIITSTDAEESLTNWDIPSAIFFSITVVTTIGYGHITPATSGGKAFVIIYALIGIPFTAVFIAAIAAKISMLDQKWKLFTDKLSSILAVALWIVLGIVLLMIIPATILMVIESWAWGDAFYYSFITLTTIGFGDFVPGQETEARFRGWYKIMVGAWILIGLAWVTTIVGIFVGFFQNKVDKIDAKVESLRTEKVTVAGPDGEQISLEREVHETTVSSHNASNDPVENGTK